MDSANYEPQPTRERHISQLIADLLMFPSQHHILKTPTNQLIINTSKVLGQERFHIPLVWLVRNIAWFSDTSNSVLKDVGETTTLACKSTNSQPTTLHHPHHENLFIFSFNVHIA